MGAREHPTARIGRYGPNLTGTPPAATVMNPIALSRYGSAGELLASAWLPIVTVTGHRDVAFLGEFLGITSGR